MESINKNERKINLDIIRCFAIFLVVLCHAIETVYDMKSVDVWNSMDTFSKYYRTILYTISRVSVPLFLMLTGNLLLNRKFDKNEDIKDFYISKVLYLFLVIELWNIIYSMLYSIFFDSIENFGKTFLLNVLFLRDVDFPNMWYMPKILGLYIAIPFVAILLKKVDGKLLILPLLLVFFSTCLIPNINILSEVKVFNFEKLNFMIDVSFFGGEYGIYLLLGHYIGNKKILNKVKVWILIIIALIALIFSTLFQIKMYQYGEGYIIWYNFIGLYVLASCLFEIINRFKINLSEKMQKRLINVSKSTLAIFFVHILVEYSLKELLNLHAFSKNIQILILTVIVWIISRIVVKILSKLSWIKKYMFYIR